MHALISHKNHPKNVLNLVVSGLDEETKGSSSLQEGHEAVVEDNAILSRASIIVSFSHAL